ncbi:glycosyltransferase family 4 protein [Candidatus Microgenomates bacterium]|nr:glycosyltransferase family 4 protein [Candidatus Microgenomates bacterium]
MKVLMVTPYVPYPPASGGQIRTYNLLKYLSRKNEITLVALSKDPADSKYLPALKKYCHEIYICRKPEKPWQLKSILKAGFSFQPFLIVRNYSQEARETITKLLKEKTFDVIHTETFYVMPHVPETTTPIMLVEQTVEFQVYKHFVDSLPFFLRPPLYLDIAKLRYWESFYWKQASLMATVSEQDRKIVMHEEQSINPIVVPNGAGEDMIIDRLPVKKSDKQTLLFLGNFSWLQNVEAANYLIDNIIPKLKEEFPKIKLIIAGQHAQKIQKTNLAEIIDIPASDIETVKSLYRDCSLFLAPIFGPGGTRLKILAAMSCGLPVISTQTGISGLDVTDHIHVLLANNPEEFVRAVREALGDKKLYDTLRKNAFDLIHKSYNWETIAKRLEVAYEDIKKS